MTRDGGEIEVHHLVSQGYQRNFANRERRLTVLGLDGREIEAGRPVKSNWSRPGFLAAVDPATGGLDTTLEREFAAAEKRSLNLIRDVQPGSVTAKQRTAIDDVAAMHLARSQAFVDHYAELAPKIGVQLLEQFSQDPKVRRYLSRDLGREPTDDEVFRLVRREIVRLLRSDGDVLQSIRRVWGRAPAILARHHAQVVTIDEGLPGLPISDHPVVHANLRSGQRLGFRDGLAIGDSTFVALPLSRRTAVVYTAPRLPDQHLTRKSTWGSFVRSLTLCALFEIGCHPDDAIDIARVLRRPERFPLSRIIEQSS